MKKVNIIIYLLGLLVIVSLGSADREEIRAFIRHGGTSGRGRAERRGASDRRNRTDRRERGDIRDRDDRIEETGKRQDPNHICSQDPPECDGIGLAHLPLKHTLTYNLDGTWDLLLDIKNEAPRPKVSSKNVVLEGQVSLTRVSECRIRVVLQNATSSDWPIPVGTFESHIVVSSGVMQAVCGERDVSQLHPYPTSHLYSLVRSIVSASLNLSPFVDDQDDVIVENDHMGECETRYETVHLEPDVQELKRTKNLHLCVGHSGSNTKPSLHLDDKNIWECFHTYRSQEDQLVIGNSSNIETDNPRLIKITCSQFMTMSDAANFSASLNLSLANIEEWIPDGGSDGCV
ncbi:hypothetical protein SK128_015808 [Halocaridina rubra]|uniref:Uncharacterized protein n=1 Tax=Halocaridina rubra TaxID=373956 RepID=A0AAN8X9Q0_HALRR